MNLKRQLLLVSLLTLMLPWAGCEFIRETETALRAGQQQMLLAGTAHAIAESLAQYPEEFPPAIGKSRFPPSATSSTDTRSRSPGDRRLLRRLAARTRVAAQLARQRRPRFAGDRARRRVRLPVCEVNDRIDRLPIRRVRCQAATAECRPGPARQHESRRPGRARRSYSRRRPPERSSRTVKRPADGRRARRTGGQARWQDVPGGYQLEARIPRSLSRYAPLGVVVENTSTETSRRIRSRASRAANPGPFVTLSR